MLGELEGLKMKLALIGFYLNLELIVEYDFEFVVLFFTILPGVACQNLECYHLFNAQSHGFET